MAAMDRRRVATILIPPLAAWGMSTAAVFGACVWAGASPWQAKPWVHGDGGLYLEIAQHGYVREWGGQFAARAPQLKLLP